MLLFYTLRGPLLLDSLYQKPDNKQYRRDGGPTSGTRTGSSEVEVPSSFPWPLLLDEGKGLPTVM